MRGEKLLDEAVGVSPTDRQQLLLSLIGGKGAPGAQPAPLAGYDQTFEIGLTGFTKQEIAQEFLDSDRFKVELHHFSGWLRCASSGLPSFSGADRHGGEYPGIEMAQW